MSPDVKKDGKPAIPLPPPNFPDDTVTIKDPTEFDEDMYNNTFPDPETVDPFGTDPCDHRDAENSNQVLGADIYD